MAKKKEKKQPKFERNITIRLRKLRKAVEEMTLPKAANFFELKDGNTIASWEKGESRPPETRHRFRMIEYLLNELNLRRNSETVSQFLKIWDDVMCLEWEWQPLSRDELWQYLPAHLRYDSSFFPLTTPFLTPPYPNYRLVGRDDLKNHIKERFFTDAHSDLIALTGSPGIGKTLLAIDLAYDPEVRKYFRDGILWARLGRDAGEAQIHRELSIWAEAVGIASEEVNKMKKIAALQDAIKARIGLARMLLVCDDVWDDDVWNIEAALEFKLGGPNCAHLITTRSHKLAISFALNGVIEVSELPSTHGRALLAQFASHLNDDQTQQLTELVGGLPLALILMGRYMSLNASKSFQELFDMFRTPKTRLQGLSLAVGGSERHPSLEEQRRFTLQDILNISYDALTDQEKLHFQALSVFPPKPNTFSEQAALFVAETTTNILHSLVNRVGLLELNGDRYMIHQVISEFAQEVNSQKTVFELMVNFFVSFIEGHRGDFSLLDIELDNITAALNVASTQGMEDLLVRGVNGFYPYLETRGLYKFAEPRLNQAVRAARSLNDLSSQATLLSYLGQISEKQGEYQRAKQFYQESLSLLENSRNYDQISAILSGLGVIAEYQGDTQGAQNYYTRCLQLSRQSQNKRRVCIMLMNLGGLAQDLGDPTQAEAYYQEGLKIARQHQYTDVLSPLLLNLGAIYGSRGQYDQEKTCYQEGLTIARKLNHRENMVYLLTNLGMLSEDLEDYSQAESYYREGLAVANDMGHRERICALQRSLGWLEMLRGNYTQAEAYTQESLTLGRQLGHHLLTAKVLNVLGTIHLKQHQLTLAQPLFQEALQITKQQGAKEFEADAWFGIAQVAVGQGDLIAAHRAAQESFALYTTLDHKRGKEVRQLLDTLPADDISG